MGCAPVPTLSDTGMGDVPGVERDARMIVGWSHLDTWDGPLSLEDAPLGLESLYRFLRINQFEVFELNSFLLH